MNLGLQFLGKWPFEKLILLEMDFQEIGSRENRCSVKLVLGKIDFQEIGSRENRLLEN